MFLRVRPADYNGWWFFMAPTAVVGKLGLPVPCFIRGDDMEYGARLARNGVKTIPMPGVAVWHEPFYLKLGNWQYYFEVRNRLMMLSLHRNGELKAVRRQIRRTFHRDAMLSRYNMCQYAIDAVRDYLEGGERVFDTSNRAFLRCIEHQKTIGPRRIEGQATASLRRFGRLRRLATVWTMPFVRAGPARAPRVLAPRKGAAAEVRPARSVAPSGLRPVPGRRGTRPVGVAVRAQPGARTPAVHRVRTAHAQAGVPLHRRGRRHVGGHAVARLVDPAVRRVPIAQTRRLRRLAPNGRGPCPTESVSRMAASTSSSHLPTTNSASPRSCFSTAASSSPVSTSKRVS